MSGHRLALEKSFQLKMASNGSREERGHKINDQEESGMKTKKMLLMFSVVLLLVSSTTVVAAGDFDWTRDFNIRADADPLEFRARLAARFKTGDTQINAVLSNVERPADAYIVFCLGEMSARPTEYVIGKYRSGKGKGWGVIAKSLGIKSGSKEFHALKRGDDLFGDTENKRKKLRAIVVRIRPGESWISDTRPTHQTNDQTL